MPIPDSRAHGSQVDTNRPTHCPPQSNMNSFDAASSDELCHRLRANDVPIPWRTRGRTTAHTETWVTCRFLAALAGADLLCFPLNVKPGDRPDLVLTMPSARTGVEITEAVPEDKARVDAYSEHEGIDDFRFIPPLPGIRPTPSTNRNREDRERTDTRSSSHGGLH